MKPKTKLQFEVLDLHEGLTYPREHEPFVISKHLFYYTTHYKSLVCLECNHVWKPDGSPRAVKNTLTKNQKKRKVRCPECKNNLNFISSENGGMATKIIIYSVVQVVDRFQVVRYFSCWKHMSKKEKPDYRFKALFEEWKDWEKNKEVIIGRTQSNYGDGFSYTNYEIRGYGQPRWKAIPYKGFYSEINVPGAEVLPKFRKYGLISRRHDIDFRFLMKILPNSPQAETLFKAKQYSLLYRYPDYSGAMTRGWPSVKICIRNKYIVKDAGLWLDYLDLLRYFNRDLRNAKFVCPKNLRKEHDRLVAKKRTVQRRKEIEQRRKKVAEAEKAYQELKSDFTGLQFTDREITVKVLENVQEFIDEGDALRHCLFTNEYYNKPDSLILSARIDKKPIETIEVSLSKMKIVQARGIGNVATEYNDRIVKLVNRNLHTIRSIAGKNKENQQLSTI